MQPCTNSRWTSQNRSCPSLQETMAMYVQQIAQAPMGIEFRDRNRGIYIITVDNERDKKQLEGKYLNHDFGEKSRELYPAKVP